MKKILETFIAAALLATIPSWALAQDETAEPQDETVDALEESGDIDTAEETSEETGEEDSSLGLNIDLGFATAYVFRGANVFQDDGQMNQNMLLAPGITWSIFDTGLSIGYWGAFQLNGDNRSANVDGALGAEQDLFVSYELALPHDLGLGFGLVYYFYPGATEAAAGSDWPSYLEPWVNLGWSGPIDAGITVAYFLGIQDEPGIRGISYLYLSPGIGKSFELNEFLGLEAGLSYGFKLFKEGNDGAANIHDVTLTVGLPIRPVPMFYITPGVNMAWTNIPSEDFGGEIVVWGGLNVGVDL